MHPKKRSFLSLLLALALLLAGCRGRGGGAATPTPGAPAPGTPVTGSPVTGPPTTQPLASLTPAASRAPTEAPTASPTVVQGTISLWHSWEEGQVPALLREIDAFQKLYPNVYFDVLYVPRVDLRDSFAAAVAEGAGPSILLGPAEWGPGLYDQGLIADLTEIASPELLEQYTPSIRGAGEYAGALISLPQHIQGVVLYRNARIIPQAPYTWNNLITMTKEAEHGEIFGAVLDRGFLYSGGHLYGLGGRLMDEEGQPAFNTPQGVEWLELLKTYEQAGPTEYFGDYDLQLFKQGRAGMIIDGTWNYAALAEGIGAASLAIDPWPIYDSPAGTPEAGRGTDQSLAGFIQSENIFLGAHAAALAGDSQAVEKFVEFLLAPESQAGLVEFGLIPAVKEELISRILSDMEIDRDNPNLDFVQQAQLALSNGVPYPISPELDAYTTPLDIALQSAFSGTLPAAALQAAHDAVLQNIQALHTTPTPSPTP